jgi:hypothetical protein
MKRVERALTKKQKPLKLTLLICKVMENVATSQTNLKINVQGGLLTLDVTGADEALDV